VTTPIRICMAQASFSFYACFQVPLVFCGTCPLTAYLILGSNQVGILPIVKTLTMPLTFWLDDCVDILESRCILSQNSYSHAEIIEI
jgi:hypothetical protein